MCGIGGILRLDGAPPERDALQTMCDSLAHRGPDDAGIWVDRDIGLVNRRLSVIGLGPEGHQPMVDHMTGVCVTYNGELYDHARVRSVLADAGHHFRTTTDTEVLLRAYIEWGLPAAIDRLHGMFAFAIWDGGSRTLSLGRDRMGIKPLYVSRAPGQVAFASELEALRAAGLTSASIDRLSLDAYLAVGYVPEPRTIWQGTTSVDPGTISTFGAREHRTVYWRLGPGSVDPPASFAEARERTRDAVERAVRRQLISDVPIGVFLSGGVDSSIVAASAAEAHPRLTALTIRFEERGFDESARASRVAARYGLQHRVEMVHVDAGGLLPTIAAAYGQPFADSSAVPVWALSAAARQHMKVALSGDGADELFGGYPTYLATSVAGAYGRVPRALRTMLGTAARALPVRHEKVGWREKLVRFTAAAGDGPLSGHLRWREHFDLAARRRMLGSLDGRAREPLEIFRDEVAESAAFGADRYLRLDTLTLLRSDLLRKVDIASMRHGLEVRVPLLDEEVVELAFAIPHPMKRNAFGGKRVLRAAFAHVAPPSLVGAGKRGFNAPIGEWIAGPLLPLVREHLTSEASRLGALVDGSSAERLIAEHSRQRDDHSHRIWNLLMLSLWLQHSRAVLPRGAS